MSNTTNGVEMKTMIFDCEEVKEWYHDGVLVFKAIPDNIVLFDSNDNAAETRRWYRKAKANQKWGAAECQTDGSVATWNEIDCTNYNYCTVRIKGEVTTDPSGSTVNNTYIKIGFTDDYAEAVEVVRRSDSSQSGLAYNTWYDLTIDISDLTGVHTLNVFTGGAIYQNGGYLFCSKITMHN